MGKLVNYITILIFIDLLFLVTGQLSLSSPTSVILNGIQDPSILLTTNLWTLLFVGVASLGALVATATVIAGIATRNSDIVIFFAMASTLALIVPDFILIYNHLASINKPLAILIMSPVVTLFALTVVEWARGKD